MLNIYSSTQRKYLTLAILVFLSGFLLYAIRNIFSAALGAVILYCLFKPVYIILIGKFKFNKSVASILTCFLSFIMIVLPLTSFSWMLVDKVKEINNEPTHLMMIANKLELFVGKYVSNPQLIQDTLFNLRKWGISTITVVLSSTFDILLIIVLMYFVLYYMFYHYAKFEETLIKYVPFSRENSIKFGRELNKMTRSNIIGQGFIAVVQGSLIAIGFLIFGIKDALFWGVISVFLSFLPFVGSPIVFVPAGVMAMAYGDFTAGIGIIVWGFMFVTTIDNVIRFYINKTFTDTHPLVTVIGVVIGLPLFGVLGIVYGPFLVSFFLLTVSIYEKTYIDNNNDKELA
ncbi:MAG: hypothetical protein RL060_98 [Bacteroidota bacterium]